MQITNLREGDFSPIIPKSQSSGYHDIPVEPWRDALLKRGLPAHLVNHLATMADLHRAGRSVLVRMVSYGVTTTGWRSLVVHRLNYASDYRDVDAARLLKFHGLS